MAASSRSGPELPTPLTPGIGRSMREYWLERLLQHVGDWYAGVPIAKFPEDLRVYEHLIWQGRIDTVIELGAHFGGSALWFRDRRTLESYGRAGQPKVISIDLDTSAASECLERADPSFGA